MANRVTLVVEGPTDLGIITALLLHARIPLDDLLVVAAGGREGLLLAQSLRRPGDQLGVLVDADGRDPGEVRVQLELGLGAADVTVFVAVPNIDAWVLDDDALAVGVSKTREGMGRLTGDAVGGSDLDLLTFASLGDVDHAAARNPSLRHFLVGISTLLGAPTDRFDRVGAGKSLSRDIIAGLLREVEASEVVWKPSKGWRASVLAGVDFGEPIRADENCYGRCVSLSRPVNLLRAWRMQFGLMRTVSALR